MAAYYQSLQAEECLTNPTAHLKEKCLRQVLAVIAEMPCNILSNEQPRGNVDNKVSRKQLNKLLRGEEREIIGGFVCKIIPYSPSQHLFRLVLMPAQ